VGVPPKELPFFPKRATILRMTPLDNASFDIAGTMLSSRVDPLNMRAQLGTAGYDPITRIDFERFSERKTGRPIGLLRGRK
jgi:hypothetical protein